MTPTQIYGTIIFVLMVSIASYFFYVKSPQKNQTANQTSGQTQSAADENLTSQEQTQSQTSDKLIYGVRTSSGVDLFSFNPQNNEKKKIFTDKDEQIKLKGASSVTSDGKNILAVMGDPGTDFIGSLYSISTDGKGTLKKILDSFASPSTPVISPDGQKIAAILFSNLDQNYGFTLYTMNLDGSSKQELTKSEDGISSPTWGKDGKFISYIKIEGSKSTISKIGNNSENEEKIYETENENLFALSQFNNVFVFIKSPKGQNSQGLSEIYTLDEKGGQAKKITSNSLFENYPVLSLDGSKLAFLSVSEEPANLIEKSGQLRLANSDGSDDKVVTDANFIIGWIK